MNPRLLTIVALIYLTPGWSQTIEKPVGCFAGTNGTIAVTHPEARGVYVAESWSEVETSPGLYDFSGLDSKIATVTQAGLRYALGVPAGALGSPDWLIDSLGADYFSFSYRGGPQRLPIWWDPIVQSRLDTLIRELADRYGSDPNLSHIYVTQMSTNGVEGHLNGVDMTAFAAAGYNDSRWINQAIATIDLFSEVFPDKPLVFEVHEIDGDTLVPAAIMNHCYDDPVYCQKVGLGMWWISGKESYQSDLITYIQHFQGDKYAQVIGRSDQPERFQDSSYATVFTQAKTLGIRYIEPWPYEFQHATHDSLLIDFNQWADLQVNAIDTCSALMNAADSPDQKVALSLYPNPTQGIFEVKFDASVSAFNITVYNYSGASVLAETNQSRIDLSNFPNGLYLVVVASKESRKMIQVLKN